jgi:hypothetical protein
MKFRNLTRLLRFLAPLLAYWAVLALVGGLAYFLGTLLAGFA